MSYVEELAEREAPVLLERDEDKLYVDLAQAATSLKDAPQAVQTGCLDLQVYLRVVSEEEETKLRNFGRRLFSRMQRAAYDLICGSDEVSTEERAKIFEAFGLKNARGLITVLVPVLVAYLGIATSVALLIATILVKIVLNPVYETLCEAWAVALA